MQLDNSLCVYKIYVFAFSPSCILRTEAKNATCTYLEMQKGGNSQHLLI